MPLKKEFIFEHEPDSCHASTLVELEDGTFLVACFVGSCEGRSDVGIQVAKRSSNGQWSRQRIKIADIAHWNPVLFQLPDGKVALYFKVGATISDWITYVTYSSDGGNSWDQPVELVAGDTSGGRGPVKNKPIRLSSGAIASPASIERDCWCAFVDLSFDGGKTWTRSERVPMPNLAIDNQQNPLGVVQPALWESKPGNVHMLLRSNNCQIYRSDSEDGGYSWCEIYPIGLPNNNSGIDLVKHSTEKLLLVCNPIAQNWGSRNLLSLFISSDNGKSWLKKCDLEYGKAKAVSTEFSYPAITNLPNDEVAISYTYHRKNIALLRGSLQDFLAKD